MTIQEKLISMLVNNGMFESQALEVIENSKKSINTLVEDYTIDFDKDASDYPDIIYNIWYTGIIKKEALNWIDKNKPLAWYREMFI